MHFVTTRMHYMRAFLTLVILGVAFAIPVPSRAAEELEITAWIPYWRSEKGVTSILPELERFTEVNPFTYTVKQDGTLFEAGALTDAEWEALKSATQAKGVRFIPTVMWANADAMDSVLRDPEKRAAHIRSIASEVYQHGADGIDIDYEAKYARTRPYFSLFLKELHDAIGFDKWIMCTIESRTPLDSRYSSPESIPSDIEYANDFSALNQSCDRVRFMTYDQGRIDLKLNAANADPYVPVADVAWVEKVIRLAMQDIDPSKILIGIPTYGYEYDMFLDLNGSGKMQYSRLWSFNPGYAIDVATKLGLTPRRDAAGELTLTYPASQSPDPVIPLPFATRVMSWSDSEAIRQKIALAATLGVRGVSIFKIDGGQDPSIFATLAERNTIAEKAKKPASPTPNLGLSVPARDLEVGDRGTDVRALQVLLNARGYLVASAGAGSPGQETTFFGAATRSALARFQKANNITPAVGYFGPKTRAAFR